MQDFLSERLFKPLGMNDTAFHVPSDKHSRLAMIYNHKEGRPASETEPIDVEDFYPSTSARFARGGLGLFSTAVDYMRFAQMLLQKGELDGSRILAPKTAELMHSNHLSASLLPCRIGENVLRGYGFGLGSRVLLNVAESGMPGSVGEFGWSGAANTYYWVDPQEKIVGVLMTQLMGSQEAPQVDFQTLAYQAVMSLGTT